MGFTDEQRQKAAETRDRNRQARMASGNAPSTATATLEPPAVQEDGLTAALTGLTRMLGQAQTKKTKQADIIAQIEKVLEGIDPDEYPDIAKSDVVQQLFDAVVAQKTDSAASTGQAPGSIVWVRSPQTGLMVAASKVPWHETHLAGMDKITFTLDHAETVIWQGLRRDYQPDVEYTDYRCFYDLIREGRKNMRLGAEHAEYLMKKRNTLSDPTIATVGTGVVRGTADQGTYVPAGGLFTPDFAAAIAEGEEEGEAE